MADTCDVGSRELQQEIPPLILDYIATQPAPDPGQLYPTWEVALKVTFYSVVILAGVIGNSLVIVIILANRRLRSLTNLYVSQLAGSDLMVCLMCMWPHLGKHITADWPFGAVMCRLINFFQAWSVTASILFLVVISGDRFFAIVYPLKAKLTRRWVVFLLVAIIWLCSAAVAVPMLVYWDMTAVQWKDRLEVSCIETWPKYYYETADGACLTHAPGRTIYVTIHVTLLYFLPILVMSGSYSMVVTTLWRRRLPGEHSETNKLAQQKSRKKVVRMLIIVLAVFVFCWTPQQVIVLIATYRSKDNPWPKYIDTVKYVFTFIAYSNSALNPLLYGWLNENFRQGFRDAFKGHLLRRNKVVPFTATNHWNLNSTKVNDPYTEVGHTKIKDRTSPFSIT